MKKLTGLLMAASVLLLGACGTGDKKADVSSGADKKEVVVGLDDTFVPMGFRDDDGNLTGFDVDLATAVFNLTDTKVTFQPIDWSMKETELDNGTIDMIWNGYTINAEREKKVLFSDIYMKSYQILVTKKDSGIDTFDKMKDKVLGAQEGSSGYKIFTDQPEVLQDIVKDNDATLYASFNEAFIDLETRRIDGLLIDSVYAEYYLTQAKKLDQFNLIESSFEQEDYAVGVRKNDEKLATKINDGLNELHKNGEFKKISEKWFGKDVTPN